MIKILLSMNLKKIEIIFKSSNFIDDLNILLNAEHLASSGVGTFVISAVFLSSKIKKFYCSQYYLTEHLNPEMINEIEVKKLKVDDYIDIGEFKKNDENLKRFFQQILMWTLLINELFR